jgi:crotonobetainyl-CoA:carnitine CoA-transferase CaiB-like acyl-CoA transferase
MLLEGRWFAATERSRATMWASHLLRQLGARPMPAADPTDPAAQPDAGFTLVPARHEGSVGQEWAASGLLGLTSAERPIASLVSAVDVVTAANGAATAFAALAHARGHHVRLDGAALLSERAALQGLRARNGGSAGGSTRLLSCADGWATLGLRREEDRELVPALVGGAVGDCWSDVSAWASARLAREVVERAQLLGLSAAHRLHTRVDRPWSITTAGQLTDTRQPLVLDLSALWAGPLATGLLVEAGAQVVKVETPQRPDGARRASAEFYDLLNAGKSSVVCAPGDPLLDRLLERAAVVVTSARPRALEQLGWTPREDQTWLTITGYGWAGPRRDWVAFGDEAAMAAGIASPPCGAPQFCGDAIADPLTGLHAAVAALASIVSAVAAHIDVSLFQTCAHVAAALHGPVPDVRGPVAAPRARTARGRAAALGADTARIAGET